MKTAGLQPYITFGVSGAQYCHLKAPCGPIKLSIYEREVKGMVAGLARRHAKEPSLVPAVTLWGAWNEPDWHSGTEENPLRDHPKQAALFWKKAREILQEEHCNCTMVAGEFAQDDKYIAEYAATMQRNHAFWPGKPHVWGMHDYHDLENYYHHPYNSYAEAFLKKIRRLGASRVWFSEQGVALQNNSTLTALANSSQTEDVKRQREAAKDFLRLGNVHLPKELSSVELVDYYLYSGPSAAVLKEKPYDFDSALLPGSGVKEESHHLGESPRQAYCVLALGLSGCPAKAATHGALKDTLISSTVALSVAPQGLATQYLVEYGTTTAYGKATTAVALPNAEGEQSETVALSGLESCTTYHYQAEAENQANEEQGSLSEGGDATFTTGCPALSVSTSPGPTCALRLGGSVWCWGYRAGWVEGDGGTDEWEVPTQVSGITNATSVTSEESNSCAIVSGGHVYCWGANYYGDLGNGTETASLSPVLVNGIEKATQVAPGLTACALLSTGHIACWAYNEQGELGNGTTTNSLTPVEVSGISNATAIAATAFRVCALLSTGEVKCWGYGVGYELVVSTPKVVSGVAGATAIVVANGGTGGSEYSSYACAVVTGGKVDCWHDEAEHRPEDELILNTVSGISGAVAVAAGGEIQAPSACALLATGHIECWGEDRSGQLGNGTERSEVVMTPVEVSGISTATAITDGGESPCALLAGGKIRCWGGSAYGLGTGTPWAQSDVPISPIGFE